MGETHSCSKHVLLVWLASGPRFQILHCSQLLRPHVLACHLAASHVIWIHILFYDTTLDEVCKHTTSPVSVMDAVFVCLFVDRAM